MCVFYACYINLGKTGRVGHLLLPILNKYGQGHTPPHVSCTTPTGAKHHLSLPNALYKGLAMPHPLRTPAIATYVAVVLGASSPPCVLYVRWRLLCEGRRQQHWVAVPLAASFHAVPSAAILPSLLPLFSFNSLDCVQQSSSLVKPVHLQPALVGEVDRLEIFHVGLALPPEAAPARRPLPPPSGTKSSLRALRRCSPHASQRHFRKAV